jgi:hypothetical protein
MEATMNFPEHCCWCVELSGESRDLSRLADAPGSKWKVSERDGKYELTSHVFETFSEAADVWHYSQKLVTDIVLAAKLVFDDFGQIREGRTIEVLSDGTRNAIPFISGNIVASVKMSASIGNEGPVIDSAVVVMAEDVSARDVLRWFANREVFWTIALRKCIEAIKADVSTRTGHQRSDVLGPNGVGWISNHSYARFDAALYDADIHGDYALHAMSNRRPRSNPMSRTEAETFARHLIQRWIGWKHEQAQ